jgi:POT family proton-dependent oligopeptide transporter
MSTAAPAAAPSSRTIMGHPPGLFVLFFAEMWERMSYYGMRALLSLYMVNHLFVRPDVGAKVLGFNFVSGVFQSLFGTAWTPQPLQSWVYGLYTAFVYLTPFFGGLLADRLLGRRKSVIVGGVLMSIGHFMMAMENMFFPALMVLILGNGCFKPNISTQVGGLYPPGDRRRDSAFSIFYVGINVGAFIAPLICGTLGQTVGWHYGFAAAGVGMVLGLIVYLVFQNYLPVEPPPTPSKTAPLAGVAGYIVGIPLMILGLLFLLTVPHIAVGAAHAAGMSPGLVRTLPYLINGIFAAALLVPTIVWLVRLPHDERPRVIAIFVACLIVAAFWAAYEQQGNTLQIFADQNTRWPALPHLGIPAFALFGLRMGGWFLPAKMPSTWYQAFNPFMIWFFTPALTALWAWQAKRNQEPSSLFKMAMGCVILGLGFIVMIFAAHGMLATTQKSVMWLVGSTAVFTLGELYLSPIGLSFVTKVSPVRIVSMMMGVWFLANFIGNYSTGLLGTYYEKMPHEKFFLLLTGIGVAAGVVLFIMSRPMEKIVAEHDRKGDAH